MLKKYHQIVLVVFAFLDVLVTYICFVAAYYIRFHSNIAGLIGLSAHPPEYSYLSPVTFFLIAFIWVLVFRFSGLYQARRGRSTVDEIYGVLNGVTLSTVILVFFMFFQRDIQYSRFVIGLFWLLDVISVATTRTLVRSILKELRKRKYNLRYVLIVGAGTSARRLRESLESHQGFGFQVTGIVDDQAYGTHDSLYGMPVLGPISELNNLIRSLGIDQVFIALPNSEYNKIFTVIDMLRTEIVDVKVIPDIFELILLKSHVEELDGIPIVDVSHTPLTGWPSLVKRVIDIAGSMMALVLFSPIMALIALIIKSTSKGPVFFRQMRMGLDGKPFSMLKFRTMHHDAEKHTGPIFSSPSDPRKTRFGRFLRKSSLDELPQLFNVLRGDMSLVGPRPERPAFVEQFKRTIPQYMLRHKVKAGMTGWAQVNGWRGDTSIKKRIEFDIFYIENWSFSFDFKILWLTLTKGSFHENAY